MRAFVVVLSIIFVVLLTSVVYELHGIKQAIIKQDIVTFDNGK